MFSKKSNKTVAVNNVTPEPVVESVPEPVVESAPEPVVEPVPEPVVEPVPEPVVESVPEPVVEPVPEPVVESVPEPVIESVPEPVVEPVPEPVVAPAPEPVVAPAPEPVVAPVPEPVYVPAPEPVYVPLIEVPPKPTVNVSNRSVSQEKLISVLDAAFNDAELLKSKIAPDNSVLNIYGWTGIKNRHFLNNLLSMDNAKYLEIGPWNGASLCAAMMNNKATVVAIDNWADGKSTECKANIENSKGDNDFTLIEKDCFSIDITKLPNKFNILYYDADFSEHAQYKALKYYYDVLDDTFIYITDDWNWLNVQKGTINAINDMNFKILYVKEILTTQDGSHVEPSIGFSNWWNGLYAVILQK